MVIVLGLSLNGVRKGGPCLHDLFVLMMALPMAHADNGPSIALWNAKT